jgi:putative N-acetylmannosamine-6-phosphate epimerase
MGDVVTLTGSKTSDNTPKEPVEPLVKQLEELLQLAKEGEIVNLTYVAQHSSGGCDAELVGSYSTSMDKQMAYSGYLDELREAFKSVIVYNEDLVEE